MDKKVHGCELIGSWLSDGRRVGHPIPLHIPLAPSPFFHFHFLFQFLSLLSRAELCLLSFSSFKHIFTFCKAEPLRTIFPFEHTIVLLSKTWEISSGTSGLVLSLSPLASVRRTCHFLIHFLIPGRCRCRLGRILGLILSQVLLGLRGRYTP